MSRKYLLELSFQSRLKPELTGLICAYTDLI